jgi:hypothetical protein
MIKDPQAVLDYLFDWSEWLATGETITSHVITTSGTIDVESSTHTSTTVVVWLGGGVADTDVGVLCHITTSQGRQDERTRTITIRNR